MEVRLGGDVGWCWLKGAGVGWCGWCSRRYWSSSQGVGSRGGGGGGGSKKEVPYAWCSFLGSAFAVYPICSHISTEKQSLISRVIDTGRPSSFLINCDSMTPSLFN